MPTLALTYKQMTLKRLKEDYWHAKRKELHLAPAFNAACENSTSKEVSKIA